MSAPDYSDKKSIREFYLEKRKALSKQKITEKSQRVTERIKKLPTFQDANTIHVYVSIKKNKEVDTIPIIQYALGAGKRVVVPKMIENNRLKHIHIRSLDDLEENSWGIPEPTIDTSVSIKELDFIIVPMVAGDLNKNRIGYGKGFYDRFLSDVEVPKTGLLFECQLSDRSLPTESFDVQLDVLITEKRKIA